MKTIIILLTLILLSSFVIATNFFKIDSNKTDIPAPLNPIFVEKVYACGKIDLIDRASPNYNPHALTDGSLDECDK